MRVEESDNAAERLAIIQCIVSTEFLSRVVTKVSEEPFASKYTNQVYTWCRKHFLKYNEAPKKKIESWFERWSKKNKDKATYEMISRLLSGLSSEYEKSQPIDLSFHLDMAEVLFNEIALRNLKTEMERWLDKGQVEAALSAQQGFKKLSLSTLPSLNILEDLEAAKQAMDQRQKVLIRLPGAAGEFFGDELAEDSFVGCMASMKRGKSYLLLHLAWHGMLQGNQVAYFQVGDLSRNQILQRFMERAARRPLKAKPFRLPTSIMAPSSPRELAIVEHELKTYEESLSWEQAKKAYERICSKTGGRIHLSYHPTKTLTVDQIKVILDEWDKIGTVCKVIVIDYAENLLNSQAAKMRSDEAIASDWALMRQISEIRKCLVVTASQAKAEAFGAWVLTQKHFGGSKMILAHVTAFLGINQTDEEKRAGVVRYNFVNRRSDDCSETKCLYAGSALAISNPCVVSCMGE